MPKDTLIIIDEIQESSAALGCLKYFKEDFPEYDVAVAGYIERKGLIAIRKIHKDILAGYRRDFSKHAPQKEVLRIEMVWDSLP